MQPSHVSVTVGSTRWPILHAIHSTGQPNSWVKPLYETPHFTGWVNLLVESLTTWVTLRVNLAHEMGHPIDQVTPWAVTLQQVLHDLSGHSFNSSSIESYMGFIALIMAHNAS